MTVVAVGAVSPDQVFDLIQAHLGDWQPAGLRPAHPFPVVTAPQEGDPQTSFSPGEN